MSAPAGAAARRAAAGLVSGVLEHGLSLGDQLAAADGPVARLAPAERARAQALAASVLRHLGRIDAVIAGFVERMPPKHARNALRLAVAELNVDGIPAHAAVDGAVTLVRGHPKGRHVAGLVNAVARRIAAAGPALWEATPEAGLPGWIAGPVGEAWGAEALAGIAAAQAQGRVPLDLTPRDPAGAAALAAALGAELLPTGSLRLAASGQVSALPGYGEGAWWVQDAAAAVPVRMAGDVAGLRALDLCAAPGGKTLQLAAGGAEVTALDMSRRRLARLEENLARTGLSAVIVAADALVWEPEAAFDLIVVDAPCSASGTIRRHPDLPHLRRAEDLPALLALQAALLARAAAWLKPGGRLVYGTCSLLPAEGEAQVAAFLAAHPEMTPVACAPAAFGLPAEAAAEGGALRMRPDFWPERGGMDGFYAALLRRRADGA